MAGFLADAARTSVSTRTVVQVLRHWVSEGVTHDDLTTAVERARGAVGGGPATDERLARYEAAIRGGLDPSTCCHQP